MPEHVEHGDEVEHGGERAAGAAGRCDLLREKRLIRRFYGGDGGGAILLELGDQVGDGTPARFSTWRSL